MYRMRNVPALFNLDVQHLSSLSRLVCCGLDFTLAWFKNPGVGDISWY